MADEQSTDPEPMEYVRVCDNDIFRRVTGAGMEEDCKPEPTPPKPTAPDPPPPEIVPKERPALAVVTSPDICRSPKAPIPYMSWGTGIDDQNYSPNVRANGEIIKLQTSKFFCCYGDEPGVGLGVVSNTRGDVVEPVTSSTIVRANGQWVQRHTDTCTLNNGNAPGEYINPKSEQTDKAPDGKDAQNKTRDERIADYAESKGWTRASDGGWNTNPGGVGWASNDKVGEEMDYVNSGRGNVKPFSMGSGPSEIKAYTPSWTENIEHSVQEKLMSWGMDTYQAGEYGRKIGGLAGFVPGVGNGLSANDASRSFGSGQYLMGAIQSVGAVIGIGPGRLFTKGAEKGAEKVVQKQVEQAAAKALEEKAAKEAAERLAKEQAEATAKKKAEEEAAEAAANARKLDADVEDGAGGVRSTKAAPKPKRQLTKEEYDKLRRKTPSPALREKMNEGKPVASPDNPIDDPWLPGRQRTEALEADHIVSMKEITEMDGFAELTQADQLKVLNNLDNFTPLSKSANSSKGAKSYDAWTHYGQGADRIEVNPQLRQEMIDRSNLIRSQLQNQINQLGKKN